MRLRFLLGLGFIISRNNEDKYRIMFWAQTATNNLDLITSVGISADVLHQGIPAVLDVVGLREATLDGNF